MIPVIHREMAVGLLPNNYEGVHRLAVFGGMEAFGPPDSELMSVPVKTRSVRLDPRRLLLHATKDLVETSLGEARVLDLVLARSRFSNLIGRPLTARVELHEETRTYRVTILAIGVSSEEDMEELFHLDDFEPI